MISMQASKNVVVVMVKSFPMRVSLLSIQASGANHLSFKCGKVSDVNSSIILG